MNNYNIIHLFLLLILAGLIVQTGRAQPGSQIDEKRFSEAYRQFDFWIGAWEVNLRKKNTEGLWVDWKTAVDHIYSVLDGKAILELWEDQTEFSPRILGYSLRYFDPDSSGWHLVLHWPQSHRSGLSGLRGSFRHGRGAFKTKRPIDDSTVLISRYTFSDISEDRLRWHDNYSRDGGSTWSEHWIMEFDRRSAHAPWRSDEPPLTFRGGNHCMDSVFQVMSNEVEHRRGSVELRQNGGSPERIPAELHSYPVVGGCALLHFLEFGEREYIIYETWNTNIHAYELGVLDNRRGTAHRNFYQEDGTGESYFNFRISKTSIRERMKWYRGIDGKLYVQLQERDDDRWNTAFEGELTPDGN